MADLKAEAEPLSEAEVRAVKRGTLVARDVVTHRRVLKIAVPIVISNATVPILGAVDTGVVGQMGAAAPIGAVGWGRSSCRRFTGFSVFCGWAPWA